MKIGNFVLLRKSSLDKAEAIAYDEGYKNLRNYWKEYFEELFKSQVENLERAVSNREREIRKLDDRIAHLEEENERKNARIEVLQDERDEVREIAKQQMINEDNLAILESRKATLDERESKLKDQESKLSDKEESNYKKGYADGVADGVRKISEITQEDRNNAMKIAMVSAASHTPVNNLKEVNSEFRLTATASDSQA